MKKRFYFNGDIITMENSLYAESVLTYDQKIIKVGKKNEILKYTDEDTEKIDLKGKTLMPAFIDAHSHFSGVANSFLQVSLENAHDFDNIIKTIQDFIKNNNIQKGKWIICRGYDQNNLKEKKHPLKDILDKAAADNPIVIQHQSGHMGVFNSKALEILNVKNDTQSSEGGLIEKKNGNLTGYMEENDFVHFIQKIPMPSESELIEAIKIAQRKYLSYGITTVQEGMIVPALCDVILLIKNIKNFKIDLIGYIDIRYRNEIKDKLKNCIKKYDNHFKALGYKLFLDGSPQGKTAWMLEEYKNAKQGYRGYAEYKDEDLLENIKTAIEDHMQIIIHSNGDAACRQFISQYKKAVTDLNIKENLRPVIIHAQFLREDQLSDVKKLNMIPSFFIAHVFYFGDIHIKNFGLERAKKISIACSALKKNIKFTFHQDSPVIDPDMFETIWCSVKRQTKNGIILGEDEKIPVLEAIKAVTINAAYQYFEENIKGSIKEGKNADLIIIDKNPLKAEIDDIKKIKIIETIKNGETVYKSKD